MPGSFIIKPLQATLLHDLDNIGHMDPYCKFTIGHHSVKSCIAKNAGLHPKWDDILKLRQKHDEKYCRVVLKDHDTISFDDYIGEVNVPLEPAMSAGKVKGWYTLFNKQRLAGEVQLEIEYDPNEK